MRETERLARRVAKEEIKSRDGKAWKQVLRSLLWENLGVFQNF